METLPPLAVTVTGSWARPTWYARYCRDFAANPERFGDDDRDEMLRDAIRLVIDDQMHWFSLAATGTLSAGHPFAAITGTLNYAFGAYLLEPRDEADLVGADDTGHTGAPTGDTAALGPTGDTAPEDTDTAGPTGDTAADTADTARPTGR